MHTVEGLEEGRRRGHIPGEAPLHPEARTGQLEASACPARGPWRPGSSKHWTPWEPCTLPARGRPTSCLSLGPNLFSGQNLTPIPVACQTNDPVELTHTKTHILYRVSRDAGLRATGCPLGPYPTEGADRRQLPAPPDFSLSNTEPRAIPQGCGPQLQHSRSKLASPASPGGTWPPQVPTAGITGPLPPPLPFLGLQLPVSPPLSLPTALAHSRPGGSSRPPGGSSPSPRTPQNLSSQYKHCFTSLKTSLLLQVKSGVHTAQYPHPPRSHPFCGESAAGQSPPGPSLTLTRVMVYFRRALHLVGSLWRALER